MSYFVDLDRQLSAFPRSIKLFYVTDMLFGFAMAIYATLFNLHLLAAGFTAVHIGTLQSAAALIPAVIAIPVGLASDRWGRRWLYVIGSTAFGASYLVLPFLTTEGALVAVYAVGMGFFTFMIVTEAPLLSGEVESHQRVTIFGFMFVNFFFWNTLGIQLAGFLAEWMPPGPQTQYQWALAMAGIFGAVSGISRAFLPLRKYVAPTRMLKLTPRPSPRFSRRRPHPHGVPGPSGWLSARTVAAGSGQQSDSGGA